MCELFVSVHISVYMICVRIECSMVGKSVLEQRYTVVSCPFMFIVACCVA